MGREDPATRCVGGWERSGVPWCPLRAPSLVLIEQMPQALRAPHGREMKAPGSLEFLLLHGQGERPIPRHGLLDTDILTLTQTSRDSDTHTHTYPGTLTHTHTRTTHASGHRVQGKGGPGDFPRLASFLSTCLFPRCTHHPLTHHWGVPPKKPLCVLLIEQPTSAPWHRVSVPAHILSPADR